MDIHNDEAARHGAFQVKAFLVQANMAQSEGASTSSLLVSVVICWQRKCFAIAASIPFESCCVVRKMS